MKRMTVIISVLFAVTLGLNANAADKAATNQAGASKAAPTQAKGVKPFVMCGTVVVKGGKKEITGWRNLGASGKCGQGEVTVTGTPK